MVHVRENALPVVPLGVQRAVQLIVERCVKGVQLQSHHHAIIVVNLCVMVHVHQHALHKQRDKITFY